MRRSRGRTVRPRRRGGKVREFARATHSTTPTTSNVRARSPRRRSSPPHCTGSRRRETPGRLWNSTASVVCTPSSSTSSSAPPKAGTRLRCTSRITDVYTKQGRRGGEMTFAVMVTDFVDSTGTLVARATMTGVETARPATEA
ncbi:dehydratase [Rhodococcus hoagii]|nr:dehydratase [Prescottella equi]